MFSPNTPEYGTYIAQCLQHYAGDRYFGRQPDRHGPSYSSGVNEGHWKPGQHHFPAVGFSILGLPPHRLPEY